MIHTMQLIGVFCLGGIIGFGTCALLSSGKISDLLEENFRLRKKTEC